MKKIVFLLTVIIWGWIVYYSGWTGSFFGLRSAILSEDNCSTSLLQSNKAEYEKSVADLIALNSYITLNTCEASWLINNLGKNDLEIASCQRKINLRKNKTDFTAGYVACQESVNAGPRVLSGSIVADTGSNSRTLIEQGEGEDMHLNESVYALNLRSQGEGFIKELSYEMTLSTTGGSPDVNITKAGLSSSRTGLYACSQNLSPTQPTDANKKSYIITCRAVGDWYETMLENQVSNFTINLNLFVSTITNTNEGTIKFLWGKFSTTSSGTEKEFTRVNGITTGVIKYIMAYVDTRDLTVELLAQPNTSSTTIPVRAVFNKLIKESSVGTEDFVVTGWVTPTNLECININDTDNTLQTICTIELEIEDIQNATTITVDFPAGAAQDKTRNTPKNNIAAAQRTINYVFGAPKIFTAAPCTAEWPTCEGLDNTPQLIAYASVGDISAGSVISLYPNATCSGSSIQTVSATRDMPKVDLYDRTSLSKNETRTYSVKIGSSCSSLGTSANGKQAEYKYKGETIAQVDRLSCMSSTTFKTQWYSKFSVGPFVANSISLCDAGDIVDAKKCNAWQWNATLNSECFPTGQGTLDNPYRICTPEQLQEMDNAPGNHFRLGKNIDLTNAGTWFGGKWFQPIGRNLHFGFWGSLDGNGFEIQNLSINSPENYTGLFGQANGAAWPGLWINNLKLNNTRIQNPDIISGSLAGYAGCAIISGVESTWINITGAKNATGGLIGQIGYETKILYSKIAGSLSTADSIKSAPEGGGSIGGMIGYAPGSPLEIGYSESSVSINAKGGNIGGLVGLAYGGPTKYLEIHDNLIKWNIRAKNNSGAIGAVLGNASYTKATNNVAQASGSNKIIAEGNGTVAGIGGFVGQAAYSEFTHNKTSYSIQGNTGGTIGGFGWRIDTSIVSANISTGAIGWENSKWPRSYYVGWFVGFSAGGSFTDNYATNDIYLSHDVAARYIGGFAGLAGGTAFKRNYATGNTTVNHGWDFDFGGFVGNISEYNNIPYSLTDNFSTGSYTDVVGLYGTNPDYFWGFIGVTAQKPTDIVENNYYANSNGTCTGAASPQKPTCTSANQSDFYNPSHPVYTREGNTWDFVGTWLSQTGKLPEIKENSNV
jgi:hypothetical protein